ncbi:MAG: hypothetical protein A2Z18_08155 [Armatimonadetes bacterium RBG_16_58_9]|nr:MAG: hypothetical protein A2Z18_08155 [Armatimonadetes bacterium RBG_16_58_9]
MIDKRRVQDTFLELARINSPSKRERRIADYLKARLSSLGFDVEEDDAGSKIDGDAGNIIAFKPGNTAGGKGVFLCCHMDTVEPTENLNIIVDGDVIRADGTTILGADDKAGIAAVIEGVTAILEQDAPRPDIQVLFDVAEEVGLLGAKALDHGKIRADVGYILDTGKPAGGITVSAPFHEDIRVTVTGKAAHAGIEPEKGVSAIVAASNAITKMKLGRIDDETTANVGQIEGGKARNIVPDRVCIRAEARSRSEDKLAEQVAHMRGLFEQEAAKIGAATAFESKRAYSGYRWSEHDPVVELAVRAGARIGIEPVFQDGGGGSDANIFNALGIPSVLIGVGFEDVHSPSEKITTGDMALAAEFVASLIQTAANPED